MATSITITQNDDQTFTVEVEPQNETMSEAPEGAENGPVDMAEDQAEGEMSQQFQSLEEALAAVPAMFGGGESEVPLMDGEAEFSKGFKSVRGSPDEQYAARG